MNCATPVRHLAALALLTVLAVSPRAPLAGAAAAASPQVVSVQGLTTSWSLSLLSLRGMDRIPGTTWISTYRDSVCMEKWHLHYQEASAQGKKVSATPPCPWLHRDIYAAKVWRIFVLTVRLANTGSQAAAPYADLTLNMRVIPPHPAHYLAGWTPLPRDPIGESLQRGAARQFGGALPWVTTAPGATTTYCIVIAVKPGDTGYGLYNYSHNNGYVFLLNTGV
jgi:hypothetical protein